MSVPEHIETELRSPRRWGLAIASVSVSAPALVLALSTWATWLLVRPGMRETVLSNWWLVIVFDLVLGALWFAVLPAGVLAVVFGLVADRRSAGPANLARLGSFLGLLALAVAAGGAAAFVFSSTGWGPPIVGYGVVSGGRL